MNTRIFKAAVVALFISLSFIGAILIIDARASELSERAPEVTALAPAEADEPIEQQIPELYYDVPLSHELQDHIFKLCDEKGLDAKVVLALIFRESSFNASVVSGDNAIGLMQVIEKYHKARMERLGVTDLFDPFQNVTVGIDLLAELNDKYDNIGMALTAYNAGESGAQKRFFSKGVYDSSYALRVLEYVENIKLEEIEMYSDDPIKDFLNHDAEQNERLADLPECDICGQKIQDEYYYEIEGTSICCECLNRDFRKWVD